ncbi:MAG TPA: hypothetical protein PK698_07230 [Bacilli bacterium]|nr:hypothetical protein [Bacilli bacterium]
MDIDDKVTITMPKNAEILSVQVQQGGPVMWAIVNPEEEKVERHFEMFGTGHQIPEDGINRKYISTIQVTPNIVLPPLCFHVFERFERID